MRQRPKKDPLAAVGCKHENLQFNLTGSVLSCDCGQAWMAVKQGSIAPVPDFMFNDVTIGGQLRVAPHAAAKIR